MNTVYINQRYNNGAKTFEVGTHELTDDELARAERFGVVGDGAPSVDATKSESPTRNKATGPSRNK